MTDSQKIKGTSDRELTSDSSAFYEHYWIDASQGTHDEWFQRAKALENLLFPEPPQHLHILEIGVGGQGGIIRLLAAHNSVQGIDTSSSAVSAARKLGLDVIQLQADTDKLPFAENHFDCVIACEVFEHFANPQQAIEEIRRVLKPQGVLAISTPHPLIQHWPRLFYPTLFEQDAFREFLLINDFSLLGESRYGEHPFQKRDNPQTACWSWVWRAQNQKQGNPRAIFESARFFWEKRNSRFLRIRAIEAAELFRKASREDPEFLEADFAHTLALCYRVLNGERGEFEEGMNRLQRVSADLQSSPALRMLAMQYLQEINRELKELGLSS